MYSLEAQVLLDELRRHPDAYIRLVKVWSTDKGEYYVLQIAAYTDRRWDGYWVQEVHPEPQLDAEGRTVALTVLELQELVDGGEVAQTYPPESAELTYRLTEVL